MKITLKLIYLLNPCLDSNQTSKPFLYDNLKSWLCFGDLGPIFKVNSQLTKVDFLAKMRYFLNKWMDSHQT